MVSGIRRGIAAGLAAAEVMSFSGCSTADKKAPPSPVPVVTSVARPDQMMDVDLDVMLVGNGVLAGYMSTDEVSQQLRAVGDALSYSTQGARRIGSISIHEVDVTPADRKVIWGRDQGCYTAEQLTQFQKMLQQKQSATGRQILSLIGYNTNISCDTEGVGGSALMDKDHPALMLNLAYKGKLQLIALHEIGHLEGLDTVGLGHQAVLSCWKYETDNNGKLVPRYLPVTGSIQSLVKSGDCGLEKDEKGQTDWYASRATVMGNDPSSFGSNQRPSFSPPELARLDPSVRTQLIEPMPGKYYLSYQKGGLFGVRLQLPADHTLRTQIPRAESIYIGPIITGGNETKSARDLTDPHNVVQILPFVETLPEPTSMKNPAPTVELVPYLSKDIPSIADYREGAYNDGVENNVVVYDDEQLRIVVVAGTDAGGQYVQVFDRNDAASVGKILNEQAAYTADRREILDRP